MFDRRFLVVLASSVLLAAGASAVFYRLVAGARAAAGTEWKAIVVAAQPLPPGLLIRPEMVRISKVPAGSFPKGGYSKIEDVSGRAVVSAVLGDEAVVEGRLSAPGGGFGLAPLIPTGMRAVSVRVNDVVGVAGFALPGMRVDVLVTGRPPDGRESVTTTVLQDVAVLSAGQAIQPDPKGQAITAPVVTLLVDPRDAETLTLANSEGHIHLVLRNGADRHRTSPPGRAIGALYRIAHQPVEERRRPAQPKPAVAAPLGGQPAPRPERMIVMNGAKLTVATFDRAGGI